MVGMRLENFGGMVPLLSRRLLPENMAVTASNAYFRGGEVRGIREPTLIHSFGAGPPNYEKALRVPDPAAPTVPVWIPFVSKNADFFPNPLVNDAFNRYLWVDENAPGVPKLPRANSLARIKNGDPSILLGVPPPAAAPTVTPVGGTGPTITRSYVYTYVNLFGEEGPPSPPVVVSGNQDATWQVTDLVDPVFAADRGITHLRIYRTITGGSGATAFFRVTQQDVTDDDYDDTSLDSAIAIESLLLESFTWDPPLAMEGIIAMPNGFFAGWTGKNIYFSEPYRPWAWPPEYTLSAAFPILDCGVVDQTLVALTQTAPVLVTGIQPASMAIAKTAYTEPCVNANSIAQAPEGVYFASQNGLMLISALGLAPVTREVINRDEWQNEFVPAINTVVSFDSQYIAHGENGTGFVFDPRGLQSGIIRLVNFTAVKAIWTDPWTGEAHLMIGNDVYEWSRTQAPFLGATWLSKEFHFPRPINFGAIMVSIDQRFATGLESGLIVVPPVPPTGSPWLEETSLVNYNIVNGDVLNGAPDDGDTPPGNPTADAWPFWYGVLGEGTETPLPNGAVCELTVFAGTAVVFRQLVQSGVVYRLPSGFKNDVWQVQVRSRVPVFNIQIAETGKEIARV
jgi:hypothetical protein